jgi:mRNA interferase MazF
VIRGGVYQVNFGPIKTAEGEPGFRGHEQQGRRYGILISPSNSPLSVATFVPTSTSAGPGVNHPDVDFEANGDARPSRALIEQTRAVDARFVGDMVGYLTRDQMGDVEAALANYLGFIPPGNRPH